ncbi:MAG: fasciclin domain-containing protein [Chloroflexi bacterium]|nr:MAG: fasciclin domain-containing protein [Chloroflexota bacterium]
MMNRNFKVVSMVMALVMLFAAVPAFAAPPAQDGKTIVDIAVEDGRFTTLVTALQEAGLVETLSGDGPFTVFAPTDDAFAALPDGTLEGLLADKMALANVLTYHVVPGKVMAADVVNLNAANSVQGEPIAIMADASGVKVNNANVIITDIVGSNGVIHVIDAVILPPSMTAEAAPATLPATGGEMPVSNQTMLVLLTLGASLVLIGGGLALSLRSAETR